MRFKLAMILAVLALLTLASTRAQTQQQDQKVIDDFVTTRGFIIETSKSSAKPKPTPRRRPGSSVASTKKSSQPNGTQQSGATAGSTDVAKQNDGAANGGAETTNGAADGVKFLNASDLSLGLGYTVYMKDSSGALLAVPASKTYMAGDRIALVLEPSTDSYLYIFNAPDGKNPEMLYPSVLLNNGTNALRAHVRETFPSDIEFAYQFDNTPATEHLYLVVSRAPLPEVPTGAALEKFCAKNRDDCTWRPTAALWSRIAAGALDRSVVEAHGQLAQANVPAVLPATLQRGIKLKREEPAPAILRVADSPTAKMLVTKIELMHK